MVLMEGEARVRKRRSGGERSEDYGSADAVLVWNS